jgi:CHAD domain-containing protein
MANARTKIQADSQAEAPTSSSILVTPIATLREQIMRLEAAIVVCRVRPKKEPVHTLRKATRYVEAQLTLLELLPRLPPHAKEADKVRKRLKSVRKAAGIVRDFDVQRALVKDDTPNKPTGNNDSPDSPDAPMHRDAKSLAKALKLQRNQETAKLTSVLRVEEKRLAKRLMKLEDALEAAAEHTVSAESLAASIERWFQANTPRPPANASNGQQTPRHHHIRTLDKEALHALRKASKLCRYMAESLPTDLAAAKRLAQRFEALQESGGKWHDWLLLQEIAAKHHGKSAALTDRYTQHRDAALASYQTELANLLSPNQPHDEGTSSGSTSSPLGAQKKA